MYTLKELFIQLMNSSSDIQLHCTCVHFSFSVTPGYDLCKDVLVSWKSPILQQFVFTTSPHHISDSFFSSKFVNLGILTHYVFALFQFASFITFYLLLCFNQSLFLTPLSFFHSHGHRVRTQWTGRYGSSALLTSPSWQSCPCRRLWTLLNSCLVSWSSPVRTRLPCSRHPPSRSVCAFLVTLEWFCNISVFSDMQTCTHGLMYRC